MQSNCKQLLLLLTVIFMGTFAQAQEEVKVLAVKDAVTVRNSSVHVELLGIGRYYSANFEQIYWRKGIANFYVSGGLTFFPRNSTSKNIGYSLETGAMLGNKMNKLELGMAYSFSYTYFGKLDVTFPVTTDMESFRNDKKNYASFKIGYRHYFKNERLYLRVATSLSYMLKNTYESLGCGPYDVWDKQKVVPTLGVGIGYSF